MSITPGSRPLTTTTTSPVKLSSASSTSTNNSTPGKKGILLLGSPIKGKGIIKENINYLTPKKTTTTVVIGSPVRRPLTPIQQRAPEPNSPTTNPDMVGRSPSTKTLKGPSKLLTTSGSSSSVTGDTPLKALLERSSSSSTKVLKAKKVTKRVSTRASSKRANQAETTKSKDKTQTQLQASPLTCSTPNTSTSTPSSSGGIGKYLEDLSSTSTGSPTGEDLSNVSAVEMMTSDEASIDYWRQLAEARGTALEETLAENQSLYERIEALEEENRNLQDLVAQAKSLAEMVNSMEEIEDDSEDDDLHEPGKGTEDQGEEDESGIVL